MFGNWLSWIRTTLERIFRRMGSKKKGRGAYMISAVAETYGLHPQTLRMYEREGLLKELNRRLYEEYWAAPIVWRHDVWALRPGLAGWEPTDGTSSDLHLETIRPTGKVPG